MGAEDPPHAAPAERVADAVTAGDISASVRWRDYRLPGGVLAAVAAAFVRRDEPVPFLGRGLASRAGAARDRVISRLRIWSPRRWGDGMGPWLNSSSVDGRGQGACPGRLAQNWPS